MRGHDGSLLIIVISINIVLIRCLIRYKKTNAKQVLLRHCRRLSRRVFWVFWVYKYFFYIVVILFLNTVFKLSVIFVILIFLNNSGSYSFCEVIYSTLL